MIRLFPIKTISFFAHIILKYILFTSKIIIHGEENIKDICKNNLPMLMCVWHGRLLFPCIWSKNRKDNPWIVASNHSDAQVIVNIFIKWKFKIIRGSSSKGGNEVVQKMKKIFNQPESNWIGVTNDGPKGPAKIVKLGSINAAIESNAQIVSITGSATRSWEFKSWDRFMLPKPFSTIHISISKPLVINDSNIINEVSSYMNKAQKNADKLSN